MVFCFAAAAVSCMELIMAPRSSRRAREVSPTGTGAGIAAVRVAAAYTVRVRVVRRMVRIGVLLLIGECLFSLR